MSLAEQGSSTGQEETTEEILKVLEGFRTNVAQLVAGLEKNSQFSVNTVLMVMTSSDYGSLLLLPVARLSEPESLARLVDPLRVIEADLVRASKFTHKSASPALEVFVSSKLQLVRSILADVRKRGGGASEEKKKIWWQFWR